jgi:signal transduction histidine kinase/CheY-like chemotaxis protein/HAMP domain-containing protein
MSRPKEAHDSAEDTAARRPALTLRRKMVLLIAFLLGTISGFIWLYFPARTEAQIVRSTVNGAKTLSRAIAFSVAPSLFFGDPESGRDALRGAEGTGDLLSVIVLDEHGAVFAAIGNETAPARPQKADASAQPLMARGEVYRLSDPVLYAGRQIGSLQIAVSLAPMKAEIAQMRLAIAGVSLLLFLASLAAAIGISSLVTRPLAQMVQTAESIARGDWNHRAQIASRDEVGQLAISFNLMLDRLAERKTALELEIQERRRGEDALQRANERFVLAAAAVDGPIYDWDIASDSLLWTDGLTRVFGYNVADVPPKLDWWSSHVHPDDLARVEELLTHSIESGGAFVAEYRFRASSQKYIEVWDRGRIVRDESGKAVRLVGFMQNVTELKLLEDQLRQAQKMEAVGRLAGGVAHDFNNLLTTIIGYSELLQLKLPQGGEDQNDLAEVVKAGHRAASLTQQLLAFSRKQVVAPQVLSLNAAISDIEKMLRRLIGEDIVLETVLDPFIAPIRIDRGQLDQVLMNVAVNARDAMDRGGRFEIRTVNAVLDDDFVRENLGARAGDYATIAFTDTGCGMDAETLARIFEPFFTTKSAAKGTGLGMSTVYGIVKQSGGYIRIDSQPGRGTTITIYLPQFKGSEASAPLEVTLAPAGGMETVMLVEDEASVRELVRGVLASKGYKVLVAQNAEEALEIATSTDLPIDLLLTDVVMPGASGRELAELMLKDRPGTRLLYMSGYTDDTIVRHGVDASGIALLSKPFAPDLLLRRVREVLDSGRGQAFGPEVQLVEQAPN